MVCKDYDQAFDRAMSLFAQLLPGDGDSARRAGAEIVAGDDGLRALRENEIFPACRDGHYQQAQAVIKASSCPWT